MTWWRWWRRATQPGGEPAAGAAADPAPSVAIGTGGHLDAGRGATADPRWVVVDVEASGLDATSDRLLAIAGVAVRFRSGEPRLQLADSFEVILRQEEGVGGEDAGVDKPNILLHGIGVGAQRGGVPTEVALAAFRDWVADSPILGYHAAFDQALIQRYCARHLGRRLDNAWADLEHVVLLVVPGLPDRSLDSAMARLGVGCLRRHQAAADSLATAEVLMKIWQRAREQMGGRTDFKAFRRLAARHHWLPGEGA
jgi:DNA polymerase-3 subunit epsilon